MQQKFNLDGTEGKDDATVIRAVEQHRHIAITALTSRSTRRPASRMDTGLAPQSALSNAHRLAVSTCQSNSG